MRALAAAAVDAYADLLYQTWIDDRLAIVFGNGGSASTAGHAVADLVKTATVEGQRRLRAISLVDNVELSTAIANDIDYDEIFSYPLESLGRAGDVAVAISASGNSPNVVKECQWARPAALTVALMTGFDGGQIGPLADVHVNVPSDNYGIIEDLHLSVCHMAAHGRVDRQSSKPVWPQQDRRRECRAPHRQTCGRIQRCASLLDRSGA
jgi:phosphoheptose isomerase